MKRDKITSNIQQAFSNISNIGISKHTFDSQFIQASNRASLIAMFVTFPYVVIYSVINAPFMALLNLTFFILYAQTLLLNYKHYYLLAKILIVVIGYIHVVSVSLYYGPSTGFELYFYIMPIISTFIFSIKEKRFMVLGIFSFFLVFFLTQYLYTIITPQILPENIIKILYYSSVIFILLFVVSFVYFFRISSLNNQAKLKEQKKIAVKANKAKSIFLANMSHEIRTPMNAILGFINILKERTEDKKSTEYLNIIDSSSKSLLNIIDDILDFSKIDSGKLQINKIDFDTNREFNAITHLYDAKCAEKEISLILHISENLPPYIYTDPYRLKQVISNLLSNAIKFTSNGKTIIVSIEYKNEFLDISVKDEGKGIAKEKQEQIFTAFGQEDSSTTREYGGTGLGLTISAQLVKLLGGELKVKSEIGIGSEFYFSIPVEVGQEVKRDTLSSEESPLSGHILLVEDNKTNQLFMKILLEELELTFDIANDGLEAIEMFKNKKYDAILMDENMPNMSGIEATKNIIKMETEKALEHTPIIALTANAIEGDRERFLAAGMNEYLTKPVDEAKLFQILSKFLNKKSSF